MTYQLLPLDPTPGGFDPSKSPSELNEVKASKGDAPAPPRERTVLEKHCDFFDPDGDGVIWPWDTFFGFWVLGYALPICIFAAFAIHIPFSWPTQPHFPIPDLFWRIYIDRLIKHGSDTGAYDHEGGFDQVAFDKIFKRNAKTRPDALTGRELFDLVRRNRVMYDPFGCSAAAFEWLAVYLLLWPADNLFRKDDIKKLYDGRLFYEVAYMQKQKGRFTPPGWHATVMGTKKR
ncbi:Caleosin-domain-containing protein [Calocera viscosa TUFC12733]|uniref:Caleosin-domain-containing protein n=1 Tax=Calocera viscosa (strain TUFC12733) TaxID=1330018 RepID=A0A167IZY5_CALVF|nr:Caleosin-domain-containing protein [Calocera viscosa TUFC12733]